MSTIREFVKYLAPPAVLDLRRRIMRSGQRFSGHPASWAAAKQMSAGYSSSNILSRVRAATRSVVDGEATYERDSITFDRPEYPFPLLATLFRAAAANGGHLDVVDFGGSLGSTYHQCRPFLKGLTRIRWFVIEQPSFVNVGVNEFTTTELHFASSIEDVRQSVRAVVVLASSSLQYVENPSSVLAEIAALNASHFVIDRTPFSSVAADRLCIQHVPRNIYDASYPCWIFAWERFRLELSRHWKPLAEFPCAEAMMCTDDGLRFEFRGFVLERSLD